MASHEIKCPHCGEVFTIDEAQYADIAQQVRTQEFDHELDAQLKLAEEKMQASLKLAQTQAQSKLDTALADKDAQIGDLQSKLDIAKVQQEQAVSQAVSEEEKKRAELEHELERVKRERENDAELAKANLNTELEKVKSEKTLEIQRLQAQLDSSQASKELELAKAVDGVKRERDELKNSLENAKLKSDLERKSLQDRYETQLRDRDDTIERLKELKAKLSTKMVGETLEQHCQTEFNSVRMGMFPHAYFEKDNDARTGSKGDFIFRDYDEDGTEIISIMFEMKNENETTATKHKNEDFFKKLDSDRKKKGCEYAVLVTLLEPESELYNTGIVDVSYRYEKMYVIRPQFFIPMITLLRNAAMNALAYKQELELVRQQNIDVTEFEEKLLGFQEGFNRNYDLASRKFQTAIDEIDTTIKHLQKVKDNLISSENNLRLANDKAQGLSIRKLTWGNKTMKAKFDEAREEAERAAREDATVEEASGAELDLADSCEV